jgi:uncharacterized SAM-binding protein YcdF (DUF218 family)
MGDPPTGGIEGSSGTGRATVYRLLGWAGVLFFLSTAFTPMPNLVSRWLAIPSRLEPAEAIVVLGAGVEPDGILSDPSIRRALDGMVLHRKGLAPLLLFSGPGPGEGAAEAEVRAALARTLGISPEAILTESEARTTREEAIKSGAVLRERGIRRILLVTDPHHMTRAQRLFEQAGFEVFAAPTDEVFSGVSNPEGRLRLMRRTLQELLARWYYRVGGYL